VGFIEEDAGSDPDKMRSPAFDIFGIGDIVGKLQGLNGGMSSDTALCSGYAIPLGHSRGGGHSIRLT